MRIVLLGFAASLAAITAPAAPAHAQARTFAADTASSFHGGFGPGRDHRDGRDRRDHRRHHRGFDGIGGVFAYDREYQGDTAWRSDGFNDWWHDRPDRSYPRWVQDNQRCERMWWSGGGWRC